MALPQFANPRKKFNWTIEFAPFVFNPFKCQKVTLPDIDIEQDAHGDANIDVKTAGRITLGNLVLEKLMASSEGDNLIFRWAELCQSSLLKGGLPPSEYKGTAIVTEFAEDGQTPLNVWNLFGVWPTKINGLDLNRMESGNSVEAVEFSVDAMSKVNSR